MSDNKTNWLTLSDAVSSGVTRPSKLTERLIEEFRLVLSRCFYLETACNYLGISRNSVWSWRKRGRLEVDRMAAAETDKCRSSEVLYVKFYHMYIQAIATSEINANGAIIDAQFSGTWQAAAWMLERRHPERYAVNRNEIKELVKTTVAQAGEITELRDSVADLIANLKASLGGNDKPTATRPPADDKPGPSLPDGAKPDGK